MFSAIWIGEAEKNRVVGERVKDREGEGGGEGREGEREEREIGHSPHRWAEARDGEYSSCYVPATILPSDFMRCLCILINSFLGLLFV